MEENSSISTSGSPLTTREAAKFLHVHHVTLAKMRYQGRGPDFIKNGGLIYYFASDILKWLEKNRVSPGKGAARRRSQDAGVFTGGRKGGRPRKSAPVKDADAPVSAEPSCSEGIPKTGCPRTGLLRQSCTGGHKNIVRASCIACARASCQQENGQEAYCAAKSQFPHPLEPLRHS